MTKLRSWLTAAAALGGLATAVGSGCSDEGQRSDAPALGAAVSAQTAAAATLPDVDPRIATLFTQHKRQRIIVHLTQTAEDAPPLQPAAAPDQARVRRKLASLQRRKQVLLEDLAAAVGDKAELLYSYPPFAMLALSVEPQAVAWLAKRPDVQRLNADGEERMDTDTSVPFTQADQLHNNNVWGVGTSVAVLDSAIRYWTGEFGNCPSEGNWQDDQPQCALAVWENFNAYPNSPDDQPEDDPIDIAKNSGHGRNVAGTAHAMAPGTKILAMNVFRYNSVIQDYRARRTDVLAALATLPTYKASHGVVVANLSLGSTWADSRPCNESDYFEPFRALWADHALLITASAGNGANAQWLSSPGCETPALTVSAQHDTGQLTDYNGSCFLGNPTAGEVACFSNLNGMLDFIAPGVRIDAAGTERSGTSMAAPHLAGAIATMQSMRLANNMALADPDTMAGTLRAMSQGRHNNGQVYPQLDLIPPLSEAGRATFTRYFGEQPEGQIPAAPHRLALTAELAGGTPGGAYLHLELIHPYPQELSVVLRSPGGTSTLLQLPADNANFNKLIGRHHMPGALDMFSGETQDGSWTLELVDTVSGLRGYYVSATLYALAQSCTPNCPPGSCGSDGCGGDCGDCPAGSYCDAQPDGAVCTSCTPECSGVMCGSDRCGGSCGYCDDQLFCNGNESCDEGACIPGDLPCEEADDLHCTMTCHEDKKRCNAPIEGYCVINDNCYAEGAQSPNDPCMICNPSLNDSTWSIADGTSCDDGDPCTVDDVCAQGVCGGTTKDCSSDVVCQLGSCDPISGECVTDPVADGSACDDEDQCTVNACQAGSCAVTETVTCPEPEEECWQLTGACDPQTGTCPDAPVANGTPCSGGSCVDGVCTPPVAEEGGCSCRAAGSGAPKSGWLSLLALAWAMTWRRRRGRGSS